MAYQYKHLIPTIKPDSGGLIIWAISAVKVFRVKCEAICLTAKAWLKMHHGRGQLSQTKQQIYNRMLEIQKNEVQISI